MDRATPLLVGRLLENGVRALLARIGRHVALLRGRTARSKLSRPVAEVLSFPAASIVFPDLELLPIQAAS